MHTDEMGERVREPFLARVGRSCHDHRWRVLGAWVLVLLVVGGASGAFGSGFTTKFSLPDVESAKGFDVLEKDFGGRGAGISGTIVFQADQGVEDPSVRQPMEKLFTDLQNLPPDVPKVRVISPYDPGQEQHIATQGPSAGKIAYAEVEMSADANQEDALKVRKAIDDRLPHVDGLRVE